MDYIGMIRMFFYKNYEPKSSYFLKVFIKNSNFYHSLFKISIIY